MALKTKTSVYAAAAVVLVSIAISACAQNNAKKSDQPSRRATDTNNTVPARDPLPGASSRPADTPNPNAPVAVRDPAAEAIAVRQVPMERPEQQVTDHDKSPMFDITKPA